MTVMERIQKPASWLTTLLYKPTWIIQAISIIVPWVFFTRRAACKPRIIAFFTALRTSPPPFETNNLKVGVAGLCWGGMYTFMLAANTPSTRVVRHSSQISSGKGQVEPLIDAAFTAHPSMLSLPKDVDAVELPLSVSVGDVDMQMTREQVILVKEVLEVKKKGDHEVGVIPGAKHGFAVRLDPKDEFMAECADKAEKQAIGWFDRWFA
jgi:dienelactone hydrolase